MNWILTEDQMPPLKQEPNGKSSEALFCFDKYNEGRFIGFYTESEILPQTTGWYSLNSHEQVENVTHWMPLPEPPVR